MQDWDEWGARVPLTVLWIDDCQVPKHTSSRPGSVVCQQASLTACPLVQVVQVKTPEREGYLSLQLGCGSKREKQLNGRCGQDFKISPHCTHHPGLPVPLALI